MRKHRVFAVAILIGVLVLTIAVPAQASPRLRKYKGQTSQAHNIAFFVARTDAGPFIKEMWFTVDLTCDDQTTQRVGGAHHRRNPSHRRSRPEFSFACRRRPWAAARTGNTLLGLPRFCPR